jgi:hypothetical protein
MSKNSITCKCGHNKKEHKVPHIPKHSHTYSDEYFVIDACFAGKLAYNKNGIKFREWECACNQYIPDNLTHIEVLAKQKGLV